MGQWTPSFLAARRSPRAIPAFRALFNVLEKKKKTSTDRNLFFNGPSKAFFNS